MQVYVEAQLDALGDATRREILERLLRGPLPVNEIADGFDVSRPAVSQHLKVLKDAGLLTERADGNRHLYAVDPAAFEPIREYLDRFLYAVADGAPDSEEQEEDMSWRVW